MSGPRRRILIPAIRDFIVKACPLAPSFVEESIDAWTEGKEAQTPVEAAVFAICDQVATDLDQRAEDLEDAGERADKLDQDLEDEEDGHE